MAAAIARCENANPPLWLQGLRQTQRTAPDFKCVQGLPEKYGISDFEPTPSEQARALLEIVFILGAIAASVVFLIKWVVSL